MKSWHLSGELWSSCSSFYSRLTDQWKDSYWGLNTHTNYMTVFFLHLMSPFSRKNLWVKTRSLQIQKTGRLPAIKVFPNLHNIYSCQYSRFYHSDEMDKSLVWEPSWCYLIFILIFIFINHPYITYTYKSLSLSINFF